MKPKAILLSLLPFLAAVSALAADHSGDKPATPPPGATNAPSPQVVAYYFHGTIRCETCLKIEKQAKEAIERRFKTELDAKQLIFKPVNYEQPENAHFLQDYKLPCPSLVLVRQNEGKDVNWALLGETWKLVGDPVKFNGYVETEVDAFLRNRK